ncbi:MAG: protein phosphatase 2C domain-containing protein [Selenomonadaceae bacterium]|nr:protein phosphatase 2C domain-containing protein [Selenomonadaceae bacterium]
MKKIFLLLILFASLVISGCYNDLPNPVNKNNQTNAAVTADNKTAQEEPDKEQKIEDIEKNGVEKDTKSTEDDNNTSKNEQDKNKNSDTGNAKDKVEGKDPAQENISNVGTVSAGSETQDKTKDSETEKANDESFFGNFDLMTGIIVALIVLTIVLIWLIYNFRKMKIKLNNMNNSSKEPDIPNNSQSTIKNSTPNLNKPTPNINKTPKNNGAQDTIVVTADTPTVEKNFSFRVGNLQHIGSRKEQQDSFCISNIDNQNIIARKGLMAVVADGMGGLEAGANISRLVTDTFLNHYNNQFTFEPVDFLYNAARAAEFNAEDFQKNNGVNGGSTLIAVLMKDFQLHYISVGDSHLYLLRNNVLTLKNKEHNFAALLKEQAERGEVDANEPYVNPKRDALTAYIGMGSFNTFDQNSIPLQAGDKILICSDGVYNALENEEIISALSSDALNAAQQIQQKILSLEIPSQDNFTAIIIECLKN